MSNSIFEEKKAFNFYRSYYETSLLLDGEDKLEFLEAILNYQFTGEIIEPKSKFAILAFRGQIHSLKKQVIGYTKGKETYPNGNPTKGSNKANDKPPHKQVQEKEEVQEKEKEKEKEEKDISSPAKAEAINFDNLLNKINLKTGRSFKPINDPTRKKFNARLKEGYTKEDISKAINNACNDPYHKENNYKYLTPEFFSRSTMLDKHSDTKKVENSTEPKRKKL